MSSNFRAGVRAQRRLLLERGFGMHACDLSRERLACQGFRSLANVYTVYLLSVDNLQFDPNDFALGHQALQAYFQAKVPTAQAHTDSPL